MSEEDIVLLTLNDTSNKYNATSVNTDGASSSLECKHKRNGGKKFSFLRFASIRPRWRPRFAKVRNRLQKMSCLKGSEEEERAMLDVPRHKSIDIGVGLARKVSLFIFTRRSVCVHPYHPYTPAQTTRKILINMEDR